MPYSGYSARLLPHHEKNLTFFPESWSILDPDTSIDGVPLALEPIGRSAPLGLVRATRVPCHGQAEGAVLGIKGINIKGINIKSNTRTRRKQQRRQQHAVHVFSTSTILEAPPPSLPTSHPTIRPTAARQACARTGTGDLPCPFASRSMSGMGCSTDRRESMGHAILLRRPPSLRSRAARSCSRPIMRAALLFDRS